MIFIHGNRPLNLSLLYSIATVLAWTHNECIKNSQAFNSQMETLALVRENAQSAAVDLTMNECIEACKQQMYQVALLEMAKYCFCSQIKDVGAYVVDLCKFL